MTPPAQPGSRLPRRLVLDDATILQYSPCRLVVQRETDVPHVVAAVHQFCTGHHFSPVLAAHVATAASELAHNLWMHTRSGGTLELRLLLAGSGGPAGRHGPGVELLAVDSGPGIPDLALALREGWSSGSGLGCGLPGVQRLMDTFDIQSAAGSGTTVRAGKFSLPRSGR